jgi:hypothetical protein
VHEQRAAPLTAIQSLLNELRSRSIRVRALQPACTRRQSQQRSPYQQEPYLQQLLLLLAEGYSIICKALCILQHCQCRLQHPHH